ncbi:hypothetical protein VPH35_134107 [Triticum aestivum]
MIYFIGCLVACAQCGLDNKQMVVNQDGHAANTSSNATIVKSTSAGESKVTLQFCIRRFFCHLSDGYHGTCYCCQLNGDRCFTRRSQCLDHCPICDPECPPSLGPKG